MGAGGSGIAAPGIRAGGPAAADSPAYRRAVRYTPTPPVAARAVRAWGPHRLAPAAARCRRCFAGPLTTPGSG
ncbi:hypothetical protein I547_5954 [Mycobacterium kansasii 824]|nr:hypothetical protein I547_5954 [Mycobacterium kansasii 824]